MKRKILPIALSACLLLSALPSVALADGDDGVQQSGASAGMPEGVVQEDDVLPVGGADSPDPVLPDAQVGSDAGLTVASGDESEQKFRDVFVQPEGAQVLVQRDATSSGVDAEVGSSVTLIPKKGYYFKSVPVVNTGEHVFQYQNRFIFTVGDFDQDAVVTVEMEPYITDITGVPTEISVGEPCPLNELATIAPEGACYSLSWVITDPGTTGAVIEDMFEGVLVAESTGTLIVEARAPGFIKSFTIDVGYARPAAPQVSIDYVGEQLVFDSMEDQYGIYFNGEFACVSIGGACSIEESWMGSSVTVVRAVNTPEGTLESDPVTVVIPTRPEGPANLTIVPESKPGAGDGKLIGLKSGIAYRWMLKDGAFWNDVRGVAELIGLPSGTYQVAFAAVPGQSFESKACTYNVTHDFALRDAVDDKRPLASTSDGFAMGSLIGLATVSVLAAVGCAFARKRAK